MYSSVQLLFSLQLDGPTLKHSDIPCCTNFVQCFVSGYACCACGKPSVVPLKALCNHVCCMECWKTQIRVGYHGYTPKPKQQHKKIIYNFCYQKTKFCYYNKFQFSLKSAKSSLNIVFNTHFCIDQSQVSWSSQIM